MRRVTFHMSDLTLKNLRTLAEELRLASLDEAQDLAIAATLNCLREFRNGTITVATFGEAVRTFATGLHRAASDPIDNRQSAIGNTK
jgi:hypothetical protein